jgi:predicted DsbA family dithiol-disulfide isomerase
MKIDVWSDIACPWCWLGKHHLQAALRTTGLVADVEFRSFELQPGIRSPRLVRDYLLERYGDPSAVDAAHAHLSEKGRAVGIEYDFGHALMANTFDAHRLHHLAKARGRAEPVLERFMRARQGEGADMSDPATLRRLAVEAGLAAADVDEVLRTQRFSDEVRRDEAEAVRLGIRGVPFFVFHEKVGLSGAQPIEIFEKVLRELASVVKA